MKGWGAISSPLSIYHYDVHVFFISFFLAP